VAKATGGPRGPLDLPNMPVGALCRPRAPQNRPMPQPRAIPARRWSSSRRSPWPAPWGSSGHHFDPTDTVVVAQGSFSPPQSDTSATTGAHRELAADRSTAAVRNRGTPPLAGHMPMHPVHVDHRERGEGWTWSTMDPALGPWTVNLRPPWTTPVDHSPEGAHDYDMAEPQHATCPGRPGPDQPNPSPPEPSSDLARIDH